MLSLDLHGHCKDMLHGHACRQKAHTMFFNSGQSPTDLPAATPPHLDYVFLRLSYQEFLDCVKLIIKVKDSKYLTQVSGLPTSAFFSG